MNHDSLYHKLMKKFYKEFYTVKDLVKMGLFGGKSSVHREIKFGKLKGFYTTDRRILVLKEDLMDYIKTQNIDDLP